MMSSPSKNMKLLKKFNTYNFGISFGIYYSKELKLLFTGGDWVLGDIKVWNAKSLKLVKEFISHGKWVSEILYIPSINKLVTLGASNTISVDLKFWNIGTYKCEKELGCPGEQFSNLLLIKSRNQLLVYGKSGTINVLDLQSKDYAWTEEFHAPNPNFTVQTVAYLPEQDKLVVSTTKKGELYVYDYQTRTKESCINFNKMSAFTRIVPIPNSKNLIGGFLDGGVAILKWSEDNKTLKIAKKAKLMKEQVKELKLSPEENCVMLSHGNAEVSYYNLDDLSHPSRLAVFSKCGLGLTNLGGKGVFAGTEFYGGTVSIIGPR